MALDRRDFMKLVGTASGAAALTGCDLDRSTEKLIPYLIPPEDGVIPGDAVHVATTCTECPAACGVTARVRDERAVKVDGAPEHPAGGALCVRGQAAINRLYHAERLRGPLVQGGAGDLVPATWNQALARITEALSRRPGRHLFLSSRTSGSYADLVDAFCAAVGARRLPEFEWYGYAALRRANEEVLGVAAVPGYRVEEADFLLTVGADLLETFSNPVQFSTAIAERMGTDAHFSWFHAEPHASMTGFRAAHRLALRPGSEASLLAYLIGQVRERRIFTDRRLEAHVDAVPRVALDDAARATGLAAAALEELTNAFVRAHRPLVIAGGVSTAQESGADVARLAAVLQLATGMVGTTVDFARGPDLSRVGTLEDVADTIARLAGGGVGTLFVCRADPAGIMPDGERFRAAIDQADFLVGIGDTLTPTLTACDVVLPLSHALESWGDAEGAAGVTGVVQPAMKPLFDTLADGDMLLRIMAEAGAATPAASYREYLDARWNRLLGATGAGELVTRGFVTTARRAPSVRATSRPPRYRFADDGPPQGAVLVVAPSVRFYDGRSADLPLLREVPDPLTSISWDAWVSASPETARALGVGDRGEVELGGPGWSERLPVRLQPGLGRDVFVVQKGLGRFVTGASAAGEPHAVVAGISVRATGARRALPILAGSLGQEGRGVVPGTHPAHSPHGIVHGEGHDETPHGHRDVSFNPEPAWDTYRWAMAIDMDRCVGCGACVAACYVENNVPITGRDEHLKGREMSWLRIEPYYDDQGGADFVPTMCQHCDQAPCESVCPVFATYTNTEGLNAQVYNRCVGTRYCANNCPYKQRRFNWFGWDRRPEPMNLMRNPDVSVRGKGIMEKCTFCVQRIRKARDLAKDRDKENPLIRDGEVTTACAQACPGRAIAFGNLLDENSVVSEWARSDRSVRLLEELGTGPAVFYLHSKGKQHGA
jgi:molybdopterin-containing oxidoreductase family iron-sulfur binding subunit